MIWGGQIIDCVSQQVQVKSICGRRSDKLVRALRKLDVYFSVFLPRGCVRRPCAERMGRRRGAGSTLPRLRVAHRQPLGLSRFCVVFSGNLAVCQCSSVCVAAMWCSLSRSDSVRILIIWLPKSRRFLQIGSTCLGLRHTLSLQFTVYGARAGGVRAQTTTSTQHCCDATGARVHWLCAQCGSRDAA